MESLLSLPSPPNFNTWDIQATGIHLNFPTTSLLIYNNCFSQTETFGIDFEESKSNTHIVVFADMKSLLENLLGCHVCIILEDSKRLYLAYRLWIYTIRRTMIRLSCKKGFEQDVIGVWFQNQRTENPLYQEAQFRY